MIGLSKSTLEVFQDCPRCFWMAKVAKVDRPRGPMPSIVNAIDAQMKALVEDRARTKEPVPYLNGHKESPFPDRAFVKKCRSWRTFQAVINTETRSVQAWGELDDLLVDETGIVSPWDFKSKGDAPDQAYCEKYNTLQGDMYHLLLEANGLKCSGFARFTYIWPVYQTGDIVFLSKNIDMKTDPNRAIKVLDAAAMCLEGACPPLSPSCIYCTFVRAREASR